MKGYSRVFAALALLFSVFFSAWLNRAQAEGRPVPRAPSSSSAAAAAMASTSQAVTNLQVDKKNPYKQVDSSFRRIPPSRSNPTQNKYKPPYVAEEITDQYFQHGFLSCSSILSAIPCAYVGQSVL